MPLITSSIMGITQWCLWHSCSWMTHSTPTRDGFSSTEVGKHHISPGTTKRSLDAGKSLSWYGRKLTGVTTAKWVVPGYKGPLTSQIRVNLEHLSMHKTANNLPSLWIMKAYSHASHLCHPCDFLHNCWSYSQVTSATKASIYDLKLHFPHGVHDVNKLRSE